MKNIKNLTKFRKHSLKTKIVIAIATMGITFISIGGINNANYKISTSRDTNIKVLGSVYTTQYGATTASALSVRSGAGTNYAVLGFMKKGTKVIITGKTNNFYKVTYNSKTAYISSQYVKITAKPVVLPAVYGGRTYSTLNVRSGAGTNYSIIGSVKSSTIVMISGKTNNFYKIAYNGKIGYVSADYVLPVGSKITT
ncbi:SH3 domain-containing protein [Clostridium estertheticum]|uniref:SH3 domain-containing protein n=1 Tax=Clostridium estertheticum TaxID=238834 RepID=UPI001C0DE87C|nr:SH3 domain-containing protein [Clostridium estertheticum]MBU3071795.1 SH3 domain-containing protein [Clostridium estertheticum]MBU3161887.1 SH3 domain-containing protein [Clostridium estertheticum]MBU3174202.1 SH3 domain-containing protein [Clostridium estertheticum]MCB2338906.1 SH3 domain-containing protein [Clostridium estertheticum]